MRPWWTTVIVVVGTVVVVGLVLFSLGDRGAVETVDQALLPPAPTSATAPPTAPAGTSSPEPSPSPSDGPTTSPEVEPSPSRAPSRVPVDVLNQTTVDGLAARAAAAIEDSGWQVALVDNTSLGAPATTLYVPAGLEDAARAFLDQFDAVTRDRPAFIGLPEDVLTLVLAEPDATTVVASLERSSGG